MIFVEHFSDIKTSHFCSCPNLKTDILVFTGYLNLKDFLVNSHN